jgi:hypothetical protein
LLVMFFVLLLEQNIHHGMYNILELTQYVLLNHIKVGGGKSTAGRGGSC